MYDKPDDYLGDVKETAQYIHSSKRTMDRRRALGIGPAWIKAGNRVLYRKRDVDEWLAEQRHDPVRGAA